MIAPARAGAGHLCWGGGEAGDRHSEKKIARTIAPIARRNSADCARRTFLGGAPRRCATCGAGGGGAAIAYGGRGGIGAGAYIRGGIGIAPICMPGGAMPCAIMCCCAAAISACIDARRSS